MRGFGRLERWVPGGPTRRDFLSSDVNDVGSVPAGRRLNSSVDLFPSFTKSLLFIFPQDSRLNLDCPVQSSLGCEKKKHVLIFFLGLKDNFQDFSSWLQK